MGVLGFFEKIERDEMIKAIKTSVGALRDRARALDRAAMEARREGETRRAEQMEGEARELRQGVKMLERMETWLVWRI